MAQAYATKLLYDDRMPEHVLRSDRRSKTLRGWYNANQSVGLTPQAGVSLQMVLGESLAPALSHTAGAIFLACIGRQPLAKIKCD